MKLARLAELAGISLAQPTDAQVTGFAIDNRKVAPGTVFGAFQGVASCTTPSPPPARPRTCPPAW